MKEKKRGERKENIKDIITELTLLDVLFFCRLFFFFFSFLTLDTEPHWMIGDDL